MKKTIAMTAATVTAICLWLPAFPALGDGPSSLSSPSFAIPTSVFSGGGRPENSTSFRMHSTMGQPSPLMDQEDTFPPGSGSYENYPGFWYTLEALPGCQSVATFAAAFGSVNGDANYRAACDFDDDFDVDGGDLADLAENL